MAQYGFDQDVLISAANGFVVLSQQQESFGNAKKANTSPSEHLKQLKNMATRKPAVIQAAVKQYAATLRKQGKEEQAKEIEKQ
jgi:hypothetical protein